MITKNEIKVGDIITWTDGLGNKVQGGVDDVNGQLIISVFKKHTFQLTGIAFPLSSLIAEIEEVDKPV